MKELITEKNDLIQKLTKLEVFKLNIISRKKLKKLVILRMMKKGKKDSEGLLRKLKDTTFVPINLVKNHMGT